MATLLETSVTGNLTITQNVSAANLYVGGTLLSNTAANTVDIYANSGSLQTASRLNFINTATVTVTVEAGSAGNANVSFSASGGSKVTTVTPSADQNNYNPSGLTGTTELRVNPSASIKLTGLVAQTDGTQVTITNTSTDYLLWLEHENTSSTAANRFVLPLKCPAFLMPSDSITLLYNGTNSRWNVVEWSGQGEGMGLTYMDDFMSGLLGGMTGSVSGTGASVQASSYLVNGTEKPMGVTQLDTGTTAIGRATLGSSATAQIVPTTGACLHVSRLAIEAAVSGTETYNVFTGFADSVGNGAANNAVTWRYGWSGSAATWYQSVYANGTETNSTTNSPAADTNYNWFVIFINPGWTRADFIYSTDSVSFTLSGSQTTGLPDSTQYASWAAASIVKSVGTTQRNVSIDLTGYRYDGGRG